MELNGVPFINLSASHGVLEQETLLIVQKVLQHGQYILGPEVQEFEKQWAQYCQSSHCISMSTGLDALQAGLLALGIKAGDKVLMPANGFIATAYAIQAIGAEIVFCDTDASTQNVSIEILKGFSNQSIKAFIPVHLYGQMCEMDKIMNWADREQIAVLEDAAQAHGAIYKNKFAGTWGHAGAFSFYPTKNLGAAGDAGALLTNNQQIAEFTAKWRNYGMEQRFHHEITARNARMDSIQAAILLVRLKHLQKWTLERQEIANWYFEDLESLSDIILPNKSIEDSHVYHLFVIRTHNRAGLQEYLSKNGIGTNIQYPVPIHLQEAMKSLGYLAGSFPVAEQLAKEILSLPIWPGMTREQVGYVSKSVVSCFS
jgi:dTDP-4-amino-4,6-dideoxygalactose transaminase